VTPRRFAAEDKVVVRWSIRSKYIGEPKPGFPNSGERFAMGAVAIYRFVDGKIVDDWGIQVACSPSESRRGVTAVGNEVWALWPNRSMELNLMLRAS